MTRTPFRSALVSLLVALAPAAAGPPATPSANPQPPCTPPPPHTGLILPQPTAVPPAEVEINGRAVKVNVAGLSLAGEADRATFGSVPGCVVLEGNVSIAWQQGGCSTRVTSQRVVVRLAEGVVEVGPAAVPAGVPCPPPSVTPVSATGQGSTTPSPFSFWPSFCR
jgi:hypothetical protein